MTQFPLLVFVLLTAGSLQASGQDLPASGRAACAPPAAAMDDLNAAIASADAIAYVRITIPLGRRRVNLDHGCVDAFEYAVSVIGVAKAPEGTLPAAMSILMPGPSEYLRRQEFIVFLSRHPSGSLEKQALVFSTLIPVRDRQVEWLRTDLPDVQNGERVERVLDAIRTAIP